MSRLLFWNKAKVVNPTFQGWGAVNVKLRVLEIAWGRDSRPAVFDCSGSRIDGVCQWGRVSCLWAPCPLDTPGLRSLLHAKQTCAVRCSRRRERRRRRGGRSDVRRDKFRAKRVWRRDLRRRGRQSNRGGGHTTAEPSVGPRMWNPATLKTLSRGGNRWGKGEEDGELAGWV